jgi:hypothetical protein
VSQIDRRRLVWLSDDIEEIIVQAAREDNPETVEHLITIVERRVSVPRSTIMESIVQLQREGKITFPAQSPQNPSTYLKTKASLWYWMTVGLTFLSATAVFSFQDVGMQGSIRFVLGSVFILGLPGYSLVRVLFVSKSVKSGRTLAIDSLTAFALTIVLSIALVSIVALVLNYTPWGVQLSSLVLSLSFLTVFLATAALVRENQNMKRLVGEFENGK